MEIEVWTDGSATIKDKPGGWAYVLVIDGINTYEGSGYMANASNNDAEMEAAIQGLAAVLRYKNQPTTTDDTINANVTLCSDSQLILGWVSGAYRFKQQDKINKYNELQFLVQRLNVKTRWVEGHAGHEHNERCDKLANQARLGIQKEKEIEEAKSTGASLIGIKKQGVVCFWANGKLKVLDFLNNICEDYNRQIHGKRGSAIEFREDKLR